MQFSAATRLSCNALVGAYASAPCPPASCSAPSQRARLHRATRAALITAREAAADPYRAIEAILPWVAFVNSVAEAEQLARPALRGTDLLEVHPGNEGVGVLLAGERKTPSAQLPCASSGEFSLTSTCASATRCWQRLPLQPPPPNSYFSPYLGITPTGAPGRTRTCGTSVRPARSQI
jgi:hypothetical protein